MATTSRRAGLPAFPRRKPARGSALLMVLWISAALAAVAFSLANTVRGETDRTSTQLDEVRGYYLAGGAIDRAAVELLWSVSAQGERKIKQGSAWVDYTFPTGAAHVEFIPETAKLNVNTVPQTAWCASSPLSASNPARPSNSPAPSPPAGVEPLLRFLHPPVRLFQHLERLCKR